MTGVVLFLIAALLASAAAIIVVYAKTGEQETLAGIIALLALIVAALGGLARVSGF